MCAKIRIKSFILVCRDCVPVVARCRQAPLYVRNFKKTVNTPYRDSHIKKKKKQYAQKLLLIFSFFFPFHIHSSCKVLPLKKRMRSQEIPISQQNMIKTFNPSEKENYI